MDSKILMTVFLSFVPVLLLLSSTEAHVEYGAYNKTCPQAEQVVYAEMVNILATSPDLAGALLRLHYVDCFVRGCEASILLNSTADNKAEKDAELNKDVRGYEVIDRIKAKVEEACPGIVSCADIIALAARDSIRLSNGPNIPIGTGRRDGNGSSASDVPLNLPSASANITLLLSIFAKYNLTAKDLVVLSGAHTIGKAHCYSFSDRLYNYNNGNGSSDPRLDANYTTVLKQQCVPNDISSLVGLDANNATAFDLGYYSGLSQKKGLLTSDVALLDNANTSAYVLLQANRTTTDQFFADFATSLMLMGKIGALTHAKGEIRMQCSVLNPALPPSPTPSPEPSKSASPQMTSAFSTLLSASLVLSYFFIQFY